MVWDHLFGTYAAEDPDEAPEYGVVALKGSSPGYNPITLTLREYRDMLRDMAAPGPLSQRLKHLWAPPEWRRDEMQGHHHRGREGREGRASAGTIRPLSRSSISID